ncbi:MAG TPA: hypothetical protein DIU15_15080, partial [Deltaproteobacteria bacterium]|nr:hypothetical protein [Deltaproteobacteria bacterium]
MLRTHPPLPLLLLIALLLTAVGCVSTTPNDGDDGSGDDANQEEVDPDPTAPLAALSDDDCPDLSAPGISTFSSSGIDRKVAVLFPDDAPSDMPVLFYFHGLTNVGSNPVESMEASLQAEAEARDIVIVVPESREIEMPIVGPMLTWGILDDAEPDLVLYDDLRTCIATELNVDLKRFSLWGHSGGGLWTSVVLMDRSDTLAAASEFSGGADFEIPMIGGPYVPYRTPARQTPVLLVSGGTSDVWPQGLGIVNFESTTDTLQDQLVEDGHYVVRCRHDQGHYNFPNDAWTFSLAWSL